VAAALLLAALIWPAHAIPGRKRTMLDPYFADALPPNSKFPGDDFKSASVIKNAKAERNGKCPCGSGKKYKACHGSQDRSIFTALSSAELRRTFGLCALAFLAMCAVALVVIQALYFFPPDLFVYYRGLKLVNADHAADYQVFLNGELGSRFVSYFAMAYLLKEPVASILLAGIGVVALIRSRSISMLGKVFLLLPPAVWFIGHTLMADDLGVRYILPVFPFLHLAGGLGLATLWGMPAKWGRYAAVALCGWLVIAAAGVYPDHLSYFNEAACLFQQPAQIGLDGGTRCGPQWLDDSNVDWGQGLKQLKTWMDRNEKGRTVRVLNVFGFPPEAYGIPTQPVKNGDLENRVPGLYAISAHLLARVRRDNSNWLRTTAPKAIVGHAQYIYDLP
jgi:hypothetical protein